MNCENIKERIDKLVFEETLQPDTEISYHIKSCESCRFYYSNSMAMKKIIGQMQREPELTDPDDLSSNILSQIDEVDQTKKSNNSNPKIYHLIRRSFAAASIILMMVFGVEQYMFYDKISTMEDQVSSISKEHKKINLYHIINYNLGFQTESFNKLFSKDLNSHSNLNLKSMVVRTRLSAMAINKLDNQSINQIIRELSARGIKNQN